MTRTQQPGSHIQISDLQGLWRRSLYVAPDGARDVTTHVSWLQGPRFYADLRQAQPSISFDGVRSLRDLDSDQVKALAHQDGFAGMLVKDGEIFEWTRHVDFRPRSTLSDRGRLEDRGEFMIEYGCDADYIEHWHRDPSTDGPTFAVTLQDHASSLSGMIVRVGSVFMIARGRSSTLQDNASLIDMVCKAPTLASAQDLVDCEMSLGSIAADWTVEHSSLPFRRGAILSPSLSADTLHTSDVAPDGHPFRRAWAVVAREGDVIEGFGPTMG